MIPAKQENTLNPEISNILSPYLQTEQVQQMDTYIQHGTTTTLTHCISVVLGCYALVKLLHIPVNMPVLLIGALLHDFYLYDWHVYRPEKLHGFSHPQVACDNAVKYFQIPEEVQEMIRSHMWPLNPTIPPRSREAVILCIIDKYVSTVETFVGFRLRLAKLFRKKGVS